MAKLILAFLMAVSAAAAAYCEDNPFYSNVVLIARNSVGLNSIPPVGGKRFNSDCIGFVKYVYYKAGLDLDMLSKNDNNGVAGLFRGLYGMGYLFKGKTAAPGDIVFFDNTYDVNRNGKWDDPLSHVGIITEITSHNTLKYAHFAGGEVKEFSINLFYPNTHAFRRKSGDLLVINTHLRRDRGEGLAKKDYISSFFYKCFSHINVRVKAN